MLPTSKTPKKDELSDLTVMVYGPTKIGKSTFCSRAEGALFLSTEPGLNSLEVFQVPIQSWDELLVACGELAEGKHSYKTVVIDTVDNAWRFCEEFILAKLNIEHQADAPYGKGWSLISNEFHRVLTKLAHQPFGLYLVSHSQEIEIATRTGKYHRIVPTLPEKARRILLGLADMILYCDIEASNDDGHPVYRRVIRTKPSLAYEAGDRTGKLPEVIDLSYQAFKQAFAGVAPDTATEEPTESKEPKSAKEK